MYQLIYWILISGFFLSILRWPHLSLAGLLCMFGLEQWGQIYTPLLRNYSYLSNLLIVIPITLSGLLLIIKKETWKYYFNRNLYLSLGLYIFAAISTLWAREDVDTLTLWLDVLPYIFVCLADLPGTFSKLKDYGRAINLTQIVGILLLLLLAFIPQWTNRAIYIAGSSQSIGLPLALGELSGYILIISGIKLSKEKKSWVFFILATICALTINIKSGSRGPFVFSIIIVLLFLPVIWKSNLFVKVIGGLAIGLFFSYFAMSIFEQSGVYTERWEYEHIKEDASGRLDMAILLLKAMIASPSSFLIGLGNSSSFSSEIIGIYPHIVPLEVLGEEGIIGFLIWLFIFIKLPKYFFDYVKNKDYYNADNRTYPILIGMCLFSFALSLKQGSLLSNYMPFMFAIMILAYKKLLDRNKG